MSIAIIIYIIYIMFLGEAFTMAGTGSLVCTEYLHASRFKPPKMALVSTQRSFVQKNSY